MSIGDGEHNTTQAARFLVCHLWHKNIFFRLQPKKFTFTYTPPTITKYPTASCTYVQLASNFHNFLCYFETKMKKFLNPTNESKVRNKIMLIYVVYKLWAPHVMDVINYIF